MEIIVKNVKADTDTPIEFKSNPKREGCNAWHRYGVYQSAETIGEYFELAPEKKFARADLNFDFERGHLKIDGETYTEE